MSKVPGGITEKKVILPNDEEIQDYEGFLNRSKKKFVEFLKGKNRVKVRVTYNVSLDKGDEPINKAFYSNTVKVIGSTSLIYDKIKRRFVEEIANFQNRGSGWLFNGIEHLRIELDKYIPFAGGTFVELPAEIKNRKGTINMKSNDDQCFKWCVTRSLNPVEINSNRVTKLLREQVEELDWTGVVFPMEVNKIGKFETKNNLSVNVYSFYSQGVYPLRVSPRIMDKHVNLLYHEKHYILISNLHRLISSQITNSDKRKYFCMRCLCGFTSEERLNEHMELRSRDFTAIMPEEGSTVKFKNANRQMKVPFDVYADF